MISINALVSFDLAIRKGEANLATKTSEDHTIRNEDVFFRLFEPVEKSGEFVQAIRGGTNWFRRYVEVDSVEECYVRELRTRPG
jgi:hypothetical protein